MTSPIDLLREGIQAGDWQKVCDGFAGFSGQKLEPPQTVIPLVTIAFGADLLPAMQAEVEAVARKLVAKQFGKPVSEDLDDEEEDDDEDDEPVRKTPKKRRVVEDDDEEEEDDDDEEEPAPRPKKRREALEDDEPEVDPVSARARQLKDERSGVALPASRRDPADPAAQFRVKHGVPGSNGAGQDGRKPCRTMPFVPGESNLEGWTDTQRLAAKDLKDSRRFSKKKDPEPRRPKSKKVKVTCGKCQKQELVEPIFAPRKLGEDVSTYVCNSCMGKRR